MHRLMIGLALILVSFSVTLAAPPSGSTPLTPTTTYDVRDAIDEVGNLGTAIDRETAELNRLEEEHRKQEAEDRREIVQELATRVIMLPTLAAQVTTAAFHISIEEMNETTCEWKISLAEIGLTTQTLRDIHERHEYAENQWIMAHKDFAPCWQMYMKYGTDKLRRQNEAQKREHKEWLRQHPPAPPPDPAMVKKGEGLLDKLYPPEKTKPAHSKSRQRH